MSLTKATYSMIQGAAVNVLDYGAKGDGSTDDTAAIQAALNTGKSVFFPLPTVEYKVTASLIVQGGQILYGESKGGDGTFNGLYANMTDPILKFGDGIDPKYRKMAMYNLCVRNIGGPALMSRYATNWSAFNCGFHSATAGYNTVDIRNSYRIAFYNCDIQKSDTGFAAALFDNSNVILFSNCTMSGGSDGGVADVGRSYNVVFDNCVYEATKYGIRLGTNTDPTYGGECNAISIRGCSWEQCEEPLRIGDGYACSGITVQGNFFSNTGTAYISGRTSMIRFGRITGLQVTGNRFDPEPTTEHIFDFLCVLSAAPGQVTISEGMIKNNRYTSVGLGLKWSGDFAAGNNRFYLTRGIDFEWCLNTYNAFISYIGQRYVFDTGIVSMATLTPILMICSTSDTGAYIERIEVTKYDPSNNAVGTIEIGDVSNISANLSKDLTTISWETTANTFYADLTSLANQFVTNNNKFLFRIDGAGGTGTIQVRITYHQ